MDNTPLLSIIILNWNTADLLRNCLNSIINQSYDAYEIIVIDNASADDSVVMVQAEFPQVTLIAQAENVGFSRGNNVGMERANGRFFLLLNPDTEVRDGTLQSLIHFMEAHPQAGMIGPTVWNPDSSLQPSTSPLPTLWIEFLRQTMLYRLFPTKQQKAAAANEQRQVENITGAALCIRRACYMEIGGLDPHIFMFYEDTDWCKRAVSTKWELWFVPCAGVMHVKAAASSRFARTRTLLDSQRSVIYYFRKHYGEPAIKWLRLITLCGGLTRSLRAILLSAVGRNRPDQHARLKAYKQMMRWAITGKEV